MSTELYGSNATLIRSIGTAGVATNTNVYFIGSSPSGDLNEAVTITSMTDAAVKLGISAGDGYTLTDACIAAFEIAGIAQIICIPVSHSQTPSDAELLGNAALGTGVYAFEKQQQDAPTSVNLVCLPRVNPGAPLSAALGLCKVADGQIRSYMIYDMAMSNDDVNDAGYVITANVVAGKTLADEYASAVYGLVKTSGGYIISGAAVRACLMAKSDATWNAPARVGGNIPVPAIVGSVHRHDEVIEHPAYNLLFPTNGVEQVGDHVPLYYIDPETTESHVLTKAIYDALIADGYDLDPIYPEFTPIEFESGTNTAYFEYAETSAQIQAGADVAYGQLFKADSHEYTYSIMRIPRSSANELSADGICCIRRRGSSYVTWGDHTSAFAGATVPDELGRFENRTRMQCLIANRWVMKYGDVIDDPLTLQMRNDIINDNINYLNGLVAVGALIGTPTCEFLAEDNPMDNIVLGHFTWSIQTTETNPAKYINAKIAFSTAGLQAYIA